MAWISTLARSSTSAVTSTTAIAGKLRPMISRDVLGPGAGLGQHVDDVLQRLANLPHEIVGFEPALAVPADLAADEDEAALGGDAVGIALGFCPACRLQGRVRCHD